jgi:hypothetical protein
MMTTLVEHCSPQLLLKQENDEHRTACKEVLEQGQHKKLAGVTHYIKSLNVPPALWMTLEKA